MNSEVSKTRTIAIINCYVNQRVCRFFFCLHYAFMCQKHARTFSFEHFKGKTTKTILYFYFCCFCFPRTICRLNSEVPFFTWLSTRWNFNRVLNSMSIHSAQAYIMCGLKSICEFETQKQWTCANYMNAQIC